MKCLDFQVCRTLEAEEFILSATRKVESSLLSCIFTVTEGFDYLTSDLLLDVLLSVSIFLVHFSFRPIGAKLSL